MPRTLAVLPSPSERERRARARVPREVAEWVVHDVASLTWEETVALSTYLQQAAVPGTGPPEESVGKVIDREIKAAMPPRPPAADMAAVDASGMAVVLYDYGKEVMNEIISKCAHSMPLTPRATWLGGIVGHIQTVVRDARDTAVRSFYGDFEDGSSDDDDEDDEDDSEDGEDAEGGGGGGGSQESTPRDDRRALFARLSAAIEAAQPRLRDSEYKELYDAAKAIHDAP